MQRNYVSSVFFVISFVWLVIPNKSWAAVHPAGTNVSNHGTVYMITDDGYLRPYTSAGAFLSYGFNSWSNVIPASTEDMSLPQGKYIPPRDGKIVCSDRGEDKGTCYLITNGSRAAFVSAKIFTELGFSFAKSLTGDVSFLPKDNDITTSGSVHKAGVLINNKGTISLIINNGLLGVPNQDVLKSWGYSFDDAVNSNIDDNQLSQQGVMVSRLSAQLSPQGESSVRSVSEESLMQSYIVSYPDLPTKTISSPEDASQVLDLYKKIDSIEGSSMNPVYPYMTQQSVDLLNKVPLLKQYFDTPHIFIVGLQKTSYDLQIFDGKEYALFTQTKRQVETSFITNDYWVFKKENGTWKWDYIGSVKKQMNVEKANNPNNSYVTGTGNSDVAVIKLEYDDSPKVQDPNAYALVEVANYGQTTIKKFHITVRFNNVVVADEDQTLDLLPAQPVYLFVPISIYWKMPGANKTAGQYTTEVQVGFDASVTDSSTGNNVKSVNVMFN